MNMQSAKIAGVLLLQAVLCIINPQMLLSAHDSAIAQFLKQAEREAGGIENEYLRENTFQDIAVAEARANHPEKALQIVSEISQPDNKNLTLVEIAEAQAKSNHLKAAFNTVTKIDDETDRAAAMGAIALAQLSAGDTSGALHTAYLIPAELNRTSVLMSIALMEAVSCLVLLKWQITSKVRSEGIRHSMILPSYR